MFSSIGSISFGKPQPLLVKWNHFINCIWLAPGAIDIVGSILLERLAVLVFSSFDANTKLIIELACLEALP